MADWVHRTTKEHRISSDPPLDDQSNWIRNPALGRVAIAAIPAYYRVVENEEVREATQQERAAIDADIASESAAQHLAQLLLNRQAAKDLLDSGDQPVEIAIRASMKVIHSGMAEFRGATGRPPKTWADVKAAAKQVIDAGQADPEA